MAILAKEYFRSGIKKGETQKLLDQKECNWSSYVLARIYFSMYFQNETAN